MDSAGAKLDEATAEALCRLAAEKGQCRRGFILQATIKQMQGFVDPSPGQNPFVTAFADKMASAKVPDAKREAMRAQAEQIVASQIYPAWKRGLALLGSQMASASDDAGLWRLAGGDAAYRYNLRRYTTTDLTPDQIHKIGLDRVASLEAQMDALLRKLGRSGGSVKDRIAKLSLDMEYSDPASEASRALIMKDIDGIIRDAEARAALLFDLRPKTPVIAQPFPRFRENNAAANYNSPPPDGLRPGVFQYPRRIDKMTKFGLAQHCVSRDRAGPPFPNRPAGRK